MDPPIDPTWVMDLKATRFEIDDHVATVWLHRPHRHNAWTGRMHAEYRWIMSQLEADRDVRAVVVTGTPPAFCVGGDSDALATLHECLDAFTRMMAPFTPFITDYLWSVLHTNMDDAPDSVHLTSWPLADPDWADSDLLEQMALARAIVELGRTTRAASKVRTRQRTPRCSGRPQR